ncbi:MAG: hypothetical protein HY000_15075 [Planctomycetes bacterium]|nr:hypothetical protein [Planctomycetota bacterium]
MDQSALVDAPIDVGCRFLEQFDKYAPVFVAFWLKSDDERPWVLCIACERILAGSFHAAYQEVLRILSEMGEPGFDPFRVRLIEPSDPLALTALKAYMSRAKRLPLRISDTGLFGADEIYLVKAPTGEFSMPIPRERETLRQIVDKEAEFFEKHGRPPRKVKLPVLMAYDLAKCGRDDLGEISGRIFKDGIFALEKDGFHGMAVEIVRDRNAALELE